MAGERLPRAAVRRLAADPALRLARLALVVCLAGAGHAEFPRLCLDSAALYSWTCRVPERRAAASGRHLSHLHRRGHCLPALAGMAKSTGKQRGARAEVAVTRQARCFFSEN